VSVIIPTYRDDDGLCATLVALREQTFPARQVEILVVDNTPEFRLESREPEFVPARLLHEPKRGSYSARNRGLLEAQGEIIAFTDADCLPAPDWVERAVALLDARGPLTLLVGRIDVFCANSERPSLAELFEMARGFPQETYARELYFGATANVVTTRAAIEKGGRFDDRLVSAGDRDFGSRLHRAGVVVEYAADLVVRHPARASLAALFGKARRVTLGAGDLVLLGKMPMDAYRRDMLRDLLPPRRSLVRMLRDARLGGLGNRFKAAGILVAIRYYRGLLRLRWFLALQWSGRERESR